MTKLYKSNKDETVRMFQNDFFEAFSKVHPVVPVIVYLPVIIYFIYISFFIPRLALLSFFLLTLSGIFIWSLTEYNLHRFIFHYKPKSSFGEKLHFIFHGVHHDYPMDSRRLVMPPSVSIPLAILFYYIFRYILGKNYTPPFFAGFLIGYLFYDMMHFSIHHYNSHNKFFLFIKKHHMKHHYMDNNNGYGVSYPLWDIVYSTNFDQNDSSDNKRT
ncbi:MAG: sterol desaturase family protein [Bacteroidota bacterium]|nr:sterol desaturase family protein [Bacteroidota bacterium]MDP4195790.1 sterol desaturase family protein [Bacteroidota bacterium]